MKHLLEGIVKFKRGDFEANKELFKSLEKGQKPHTLFITCCDSRLNPNMITGTLPGELFIIRNIANIVPPIELQSEYKSTTSAVEYAVLHLNVENIIVCGHTNCGGCIASLKRSKHELCDSSEWLDLLEPSKDKVLKELGDDTHKAQQWMMEQVNIVEQLKHLLTYDYIREKVATGALTLGGWHYCINTGEIRIYDEESSEFILANK